MGKNLNTKKYLVTIPDELIHLSLSEQKATLENLDNSKSDKVAKPNTPDSKNNNQQETASGCFPSSSLILLFILAIICFLSVIGYLLVLWETGYL